MDKNKNLTPDAEGPWIVTLTDEESGEDLDFQIIADAKIGEKTYYALIPVGDESGECIILEYRTEGDEVVFETVDDDDEFEVVEDYFNDLLFGEVNYDEGDNN
ncbi:MAG: DUF1292 domain-containing protein [Clostridia bacterium]|nr:DUF1292 domain-containing protein [Clostridia bacterium]